jgi:hypothetical protein
MSAGLNWHNFLESAGAMLLTYFLVVRPLWLLAWRLPPLPKKPVEMTGKAINALELSERVQQVREEMKQKRTSGETFTFKRELRISDARTRVARMAFLQIPPPSPPEASDPDHSLDLLLI